MSRADRKTMTLRDFGGGADDIDVEAHIVDLGDDNQRLKLLRCPACGVPFNATRRKMWDPVAEHIADAHGPADFGLSERGERR